MVNKGLNQKKKIFKKKTHFHVSLPSRLKNCHGSERSRSHGNVWQLVCRAMWMDGEEVGTSGIYPSENKGCTNLPLISITQSTGKRVRDMKKKKIT